MNCQMQSIYEFLLKSKTAANTQDTGYVDLGLPSGLLWGKCNIGADEPTEYGDYFMWGSAEPDTDKPCDWKHCPFNNDSNDYDEDYFYSVKDSVCPNDILAPEYDAATAILGDDWRLPTKNDFEELFNNTTNTWVTNYQNSSINGMVFTSKTDDNKTLFIPASGFRSGSSFYLRGSRTYLWSSSLFTSERDYAWDLDFNNSFCYMYNDVRYCGLCLRGVTK